MLYKDVLTGLIITEKTENSSIDTHVVSLKKVFIFLWLYWNANMLSMHSYGNRDNTIDSINCKRIHFSRHFSLEFYYSIT